MFLVFTNPWTCHSLSSTSTLSERIEQLERHLMDCKDAVAAAKEEVKNDPVTNHIQCI